MRSQGFTKLTIISILFAVSLAIQVSFAGAEPTDSSKDSEATNSEISPEEPQLDDPQDENASPFSRYFHTYNSDYQYFFMRRNMKLDTVLASASVQQSSKGALDIEAKAFLPIYESERFSFVLPFYMYRYGLSNAQKKELPFGAVQASFWQAIFTAKLSKTLQLALITEGRHNGTEESQWSRVGTELAEFVVLKWQPSREWTFAPAFRVKGGWNSEGDVEYQVLPAGNIIWRPKRNLAVMTGLPSFVGFEWATPRLDMAAHVMLAEGNNVNVMTAARLHVTPSVATTARFLRDGYQDLYVPNFAFEQGGQQMDVTQISQYKNRAQLELEVATSSHSLIQLKAGYSFDEGIALSGQDGDSATVDGENGLYLGATLVSYFDLSE